MPKRTVYLSFIGMLILTILPLNAIALSLGSQSFPHINFSDDTITQAEIEVVSTDVEEPAILPDNALYPVKKLKEKIILLITTNKEKRAELYLRHAQIRLAEAHALIEQNKKDNAQNVLAEFEEEMLQYSRIIDTGNIKLDKKIKVLENKNQLIYEIIQEKTDKKESISTNKSKEIKHEKKSETNKTKKSEKEIAIRDIVNKVNQSITGNAILENNDTPSREEKSDDKKTKEKDEVAIQEKKDMIEKAKRSVEIVKSKKEEEAIQKPKDIAENSKKDVVVNISKDEKSEDKLSAKSEEKTAGKARNVKEHIPKKHD